MIVEKGYDADIFSRDGIRNGDYYPERNTSREFMSDAEREEFEHNLTIEEKRKVLQENGFLDKSVVYRINSNGFRGNELLENDFESVVTFGCSFCFGSGLFEEDTLAGQIERKLNRRAYNLSGLGRGMDAVVRWSAGWLPYIKPKYVVLLQPFPARREFFFTDTFQRITSTHSINSFEGDPEFGLKLAGLVLDDVEVSLNTVKNMMIFKQLCADNGSKLIIIPNPSYWNHDATARDLVHPGAKYIEKMIDKYVIPNTQPL